VLTRFHSPNDVGEADDLSLLTTPQGIRFEERDHSIKEISTPTENEHMRVVIR
jgi:hypothetical protein